MKTRPLLVTLASSAVCASLAFLGAQALSDNADAPKQPTPYASPSYEPAPETTEPEADVTVDTRAIAKIVWDDAPEADKDAMCFGAEAGGHEFIVGLLKDGGNNNEAIDWDVAADYIEEECAKR